MNKKLLLDCTLRDGGYLNDWKFGHNVLTSVFERLVSANVDIIEVGFLDERRKFDMNRSIFPDSNCAEWIYGKIDKKNAMVVGMIDYGTCQIEHLQPCCDCYLDGIRVIFKEHVMYEAVEFCKKVKALGYQVFMQMVSITTYSDEKLIELMHLVNEVKPFAVSMVDTYGLLHQDNLLHIFDVMNQHLLSDIAVGYHSHNNFQMGYANCIEFLSQKVERTVLVDATLYGMGKSAGNTPIELLSMYMNQRYHKSYDVSQLLEAIEVNIMEIQKKVHWGYNLFYYVAAFNKCHPNYVSYLMNKKTLSIKSINEILSSIEEKKKLLYDAKYIEQLYLKYQKINCDDSEALLRLEKELFGKQVLVLGPGKSISEYSEEIKKYIEKKKPTVISINYIPKAFQTEYVFLSNAKRYVQINTELYEEKNKEIKIIATSNVMRTSGIFSYELKYSTLIDEHTEIPDNSLIMLLRVFLKIGIKEVALAGFDGYSEHNVNYFNTNMEYHFAKEKAKYLNQYTKTFLEENKEKIEVIFVTKSHYQEG